MSSENGAHPLQADLDAEPTANVPRAANRDAEENAPEDDAFVVDWRRLLINAFVIWQIFVVSVWLLPTSALQLSLASLARPYMMLTGCWQAWTMFSPQPSNTDMYLKAVIDYKDGSTRAWDFPRMDRLDLWTRYREERWRKAIENTEGDQARGYWPYLARYAALRNDPQPQINPPVEVHLIRNFRLIPPPGIELPPFKDYEFCEQAITPELLRGDALTLPPVVKPVNALPKQEQKTGSRTR